MKLTTMMSTMLASSLLLAGLTSGPALADDGEINNKSMSRTINVPTFDQEIVNNALSEAEHAFTDMMKFYVPAQAASGEPAGDGTGLITYNNIDGNLVEELPVAKPLVNVFIYGPAFGVDGTAFAHRWFDTYAAVSLDDGVTFKQTNLSESADLSSFNLDTDHNPSGGGGGGGLPQGHNIELTDDGDSAFHAAGYDTPYSSGCTECHGVALQGVTGAPSCYSCHENEWSEETPVELGPIVYEAVWEADGSGGKLVGKGENAADSAEVSILNGVNGHLVGTIEAEDDGKFAFELEVLPPCTVAAEYTDNNGEVFTGPAISVIDDDTGEPVTECEGLPVDLTEYPGGTYNVFHATTGNKTLVAWPSRYCSGGQPAYQMSTDTQPDLERLAAVTAFIQAGDTDLGVPALPDFTAPINGVDDLTGVDDLYLLDAFGVAGNQGSVDFADEGYPQAGVVPFGCVWTARGILLPGDDPRTADAAEQSHMVWTKAERLTSGRRDPNRIEVKAVKDAGFVITWQEDPEGLRPGQGLGPGEGWSGAVAHSQTDVWYSFINYEYFDIVETVDNTTVPINVLDHDLTLTGRPQVFVPMAVPMRTTNNAKCNAPVEGVITDDLYCDFVLAEPFGIKDQCADTVTILTGNPNNPGGVTESEICVADADGDGVADLPNRANTAATRPRLGLQGYDLTTDDKSAWVVFATEESKGLGAFFFTPDDNGDGLAQLCSEGDELPCTEEIGKNQWYFSFDMGTPDTSAGIDQPNSLVENLVYQGDLLNQGEVYWETGELFGLMDTAVMGENGGSLYDPYDFQILNTEIARRASLLIQPIAKAVAAGENSLVAIPSWKQGIMRQGGPADTMLRRMVLPDDYVVDPGDTDTDGDGVLDCEDNCTLVANPDQYDTDGDLYGNMCDADLDNNLNVNYDDLDLFKLAWGSTGQGLDADFNGDEVVNYDDLEIFKLLWGSPPGPSCIDTGDCICDVVTAAAELPVGMDINPYAFENMVCESFLIEPDTNPYYPGGVCADPATNLSGVVPDVCLDDDTGGVVDCPTVDFTSSTYGIGDTNPILQGVVQGEGNKQRVIEWHQCPSDYTVVATDLTDAVDCDTDDRTDDFVNLLDQSWYNPLDISKGHRGFIDGDMVMFLYAWSPNWRLNAKGSDRYELYVRRSFDGGATWVTTPSSGLSGDGVTTFNGDGTVTCESYRSSETGTGDVVEPKACYEFAAGAAEHARNITQHKSMRITTLDPRYAPTPASITDTCLDGLVFVDDTGTPIESGWSCDDTSAVQDTDLRNPSRYFMVFETGDNTTVEVGEAEPLDLFYGRAESFGDDYVVWTETDTGTADATVCYPSDPHDVLDVSDVIIDSGFCNEFDNMNTGGDTRSSEANMEGNPDGSKLYSVWAQWVFDESGEEVIESDAMARRIWWLDDYVSETESYTLPGTQTP